MAVSTRNLKGLRLLVVEDRLLEAEAICEALERCGCEIVGPEGRIDRAAALAYEAALDGAVLDIDLAGYLSFPVAGLLQCRGIPFIFITGHAEAARPPAHHSVPLLKKPFRGGELPDFLARHLAPCQS